MGRTCQVFVEHRLHNHDHPAGLDRFMARCKYAPTLGRIPVLGDVGKQQYVVALREGVFEDRSTLEAILQLQFRDAFLSLGTHGLQVKNFGFKRWASLEEGHCVAAGAAPYVEQPQERRKV